jgi:hypothetical protein
MLFPRAHAWSPVQKWLIVAVGVVVIAVSCLAIYMFERFHGLPSDRILVGTWETSFPYCMDNCAFWIRFNSDHTAICFSRSGDGIGFKEDFRTPWVGLGPYVFMRLERKRVIWQIIEIGPGELHLRAAKTDYVFKRVSLDLPEASNQTMERTPGSTGPPIELEFYPEPTATSSPASRRSSYSR